MKKVFFPLLLTFIPLGYCQSFNVSSDTVEGTYEVNEYAYDYIYVNNNSGVSLTLNFSVLTNTCESNGWFNTLCTSYTCYPEIPSSGTLGSLPDGAIGNFACQVGFEGIPGEGSVRIRVYESTNPSNADTLTYLYHAYSTAGIIVSNPDIDIKLYPNPVIDILHIQSNNFIPDGLLRILDASGKVMLEQLFPFDVDNIQINQFAKGLYFLSIYSANENVYSGKFLKQ